jgi:hypothetical protein
MAVTHDMAHSFGSVDAVPVKTDERGESQRARHGTDRRHGHQDGSTCPWPLAAAVDAKS